MMKRTKGFKSNISSGISRKFNGREEIEALYKTADWVKYSRKFLELNPRCYSCGEPSQVTDHVVVHKGDMELFQKTDNSLPLCVRCHNTVTAKFDRYGKSKLQDKLQWLASNRAIKGLSFSVKVLASFFQR